MINVYEDLMIDSSEDIVDNLINMFNKEGDEVLGFQEFMIANHLSITDKEADKLKWQFLIYDRDGSGSLTRDEMTSMFVMMYQDPDQSKAEQKIAVKEITGKAEELFVKLDADSNGFVTMEEFIKGSLSDGGQ